MVIVGAKALPRADGQAVLAAAARIAAAAMAGKDECWNAFNVLHTAASRVAGLDLGFVPKDTGLDVDGMLTAAGNGSMDLIYLLGADEIDMAPPRLGVRRLPGQPRRCGRPSRRRHSSRPPPTRKRARPTSTPRAACR